MVFDPSKIKGSIPTFKSGLFESTSETDNFEPKTRQLDMPGIIPKMRIIPVGRGYSNNLEEVLLNPESITESKSANWVKQNTPGHSDPILQWISGNERVISFNLRVTKDTANTSTVSNTTFDRYVLRTIAQYRGLAGLDIVEEIPSNEAELLNAIGRRNKELDEANKNTLSGEGAILRQVGVPIAELQPVSPAAEFTHYLPLSIQAYLDFYRSLLYPRQSVRGGKPNPPPLIRIIYGSVLGDELVAQQTYWVLAQYNISVNKFAPVMTSSKEKNKTMIPIDATVQLTLIEYTARAKQYNEAVGENFVPEYQKSKKSQIKSS